MLAPGNPQHIHSLADLGRGEVSFINRNPGSGTRLWLDKQLSRMGIPGEQIHGYSRVAYTHTAVAQAVAQGVADTALGLAAAAHQHNLEFIPLFQERFDLVMPAESLHEVGPSRLLDAVHGGAFRHMAEALGGYDTHHTGEELST
jgi:putative molybdopterin biosynthesis protein